MSISKFDFKVIFNKIMNSDNDTVKLYINNLRNNNKTGEYQIDNIVNKYNSNYILRVINKINNKILSGGNNTTSVEEPKEEYKLNFLTETTTNVEPIQVVNILNNLTGTILPVKINESVTPSKMTFEFNDRIFMKDDSITSSEMPFMIGGNNTQASDTSSAIPPIDTMALSDTSSAIASSATSSAIPSIDTLALSDTSSTNGDLTDKLSSEVIEPVTKSEMSEIFVTRGIEPVSLKEKVDTLIKNLKKKSELLKEKEMKMKEKEDELERRQKIVIQLEEDGKDRLDKIKNDLDDLIKQKDSMLKQRDEYTDESNKVRQELSEISNASTEIDGISFLKKFLKIN